jgi:hypothetical protein
MKIYISKYRYHWISPYHILEKVLFWKDWDKIDYETPWVEKWSDRLNPFCEFLQKFLNIVHPKINYVKIDKWDTWNMDSTLSLIVLPMLKQLQATKHGAPLVDDEDVPENIRSTSAKIKENEWDIDGFHFERWDWVMNEMIWTFEQLQPNNDWEKQYYSGEHDIAWKASEQKDENGQPLTYEMIKTEKDTFKIDEEGLKKHNDRIQNGLRLFGKYYRGLWD